MDSLKVNVMERRQSYRTVTNREVTGRAPATPIAGTLLDISDTGCLLRSAAKLLPGTTIVLELSATEHVAGQIAWRKGDRSGIKFHEKLCSETLLGLIGTDVDHLDNSGGLRDRFGRGLPDLPSIRLRHA
jgi:hypothetical protein